MCAPISCHSARDTQHLISQDASPRRPVLRRRAHSETGIVGRGSKVFNAEQVKKRCNGMLTEAVYQRIYESAHRAPLGHAIEVGAAHGAATVSLAQAIRDTGGGRKVFSFEKIVGGSREKYGTYSRNEQILRENFRYFGVEDTIKLIVGDVRECAHHIEDDSRFGLMMLDADGCIDRDFKLFFDRLVPDGLVIIDDIADRVRLKRLGLSGLSVKYKVDQKHRLSFLLLELFQRNGLLDAGELVGGTTWFGRRLDVPMCQVPDEEIREIYRSLVFADAKISSVPFRKTVALLGKSILSQAMIRSLKGFETGHRDRP